MPTRLKDPIRILTVSDYLRDAGMSDQDARKIYSQFGRLVKRKYMMAYGRAPITGPRFIQGRRVDVCVYRERDRGLFDMAWAELTLNIRVSF